jgi:hypothetical protein
LKNDKNNSNVFTIVQLTQQFLYLVLAWSSFRLGGRLQERFLHEGRRRLTRLKTGKRRPLVQRLRGQLIKLCFMLAFILLIRNDYLNLAILDITVRFLLGFILVFFLGRLWTLLLDLNEVVF